MKLTMLSILLLIIILGCTDQTSNRQVASSKDSQTSKETSVPKEVREQLETVAKAQSRGLANATATIHRAYNYNGFSFFKPERGDKLVAVDVEFTGYNEDFDLDDVDIVDGSTGENYGSDPDINLLTLTGSIEPDEFKWPKSPRPVRVLLIYAVPVRSTSIKLSYWGQELSPRPVALKGKGPLLRKPTS